MTRTFHILYWIKRLYRNDENISHFILNQKVKKKWRELFTFYIESKDYKEIDENFSHFILNQKVIEKWREHFTFYIESKDNIEMTRTFHILYWIKRL